MANKTYQKVKTSMHISIFQTVRMLKDLLRYSMIHSQGDYFPQKIHIFNLMPQRQNSWPKPISNLIKSQYCKVVFVIKQDIGPTYFVLLRALYLAFYEHYQTLK